MSKMKFQDWLKENTIAIDGSIVNTPTGTSKTDHEIMAGEWNQVGIAAPVGTPQQLAGVAKPTGEVAEHPGIVTSVNSIKSELEKPGLKEAIAALSPTLAEALSKLHEVTITRISAKGTSKKSYGATHKVDGEYHNSTIPKGSNVSVHYNPIDNTSAIHHYDSNDNHHMAIVSGHYDEHIE